MRIRHLRHFTPLSVLVIAAWLTAWPAVAQYDIDWYTMDDGGDMWTIGGTFELSGTIGQADANVVVMTGGDFELTGGFWPGMVGPSLYPGDMDCDGDVDFDDINPFVLALSGPAAYYAEYPDCNWLHADCDGDGDVDFDDINPFVALIGS